MIINIYNKGTNNKSKNKDRIKIKMIITNQLTKKIYK